MHLFIITIYVHRLESGLNCHLQICQFQEGTRLSLGGVNAPPCPPPPERNPGHACRNRGGGIVCDDDLFQECLETK